jgi:hypothetical protein
VRAPSQPGAHGFGDSLLSGPEPGYPAGPRWARRTHGVEQAAFGVSEERRQGPIIPFCDLLDVDPHAGQVPGMADQRRGQRSGMREGHLRRLGKGTPDPRPSRGVVADRDLDRKDRARTGVPQPLPDCVLDCDPTQQPLPRRTWGPPLVVRTLGGAEIAAHDQLLGRRVRPSILD